MNIIHKDIEFSNPLNETYKTIRNWCEMAEITLNLEKAQFMMVGRRRMSRPIKLLNNKIKLIKHKVPGHSIRSDPNLNWSEHTT